MTKTIAALLLLFVTATSSQAQPAAADACLRLKDTLDIDTTTFTPLPQTVCRIDEGCLKVDWNIVSKQQLTETLAKFRFTEKAPLKIHTSNLNFLLYTVQWTKVVERQNQAFESVTSVFEKVFPLLSLVSGMTGLAANRQGPQPDPLLDWVIPLEQASLCLSSTVAAYTSMILDKEGTAKRQRLHFVNLLLTGALPRLSELRLKYLERVSETLKQASDSNAAEIAAERFDTYLKAAQRHAELEQRTAEFLPLARTSVEGLMSVVGTEKRNSFVIVTGRTAKRSGESAGEVSARYFVAWSKPVAYHVGYGYGRLKDFDFKQVRALSGQDVFTATQPQDDDAAGESGDSSAGPEPVAFLTWEGKAWGPNDRHGLGLTFGTGLNAPGESLYSGATLRVFGRLLLTGGMVWAKATRGEGKFIETLVTSSPRVLFSELEEQTATKPFFSVSFKVY